MVTSSAAEARSPVGRPRGRLLHTACRRARRRPRGQGQAPAGEFDLQLARHPEPRRVRGRRDLPRPRLHPIRRAGAPGVLEGVRSRHPVPSSRSDPAAARPHGAGARFRRCATGPGRPATGSRCASLQPAPSRPGDSFQADDVSLVALTGDGQVPATPGGLDGAGHVEHRGRPRLERILRQRGRHRLHHLPARGPDRDRERHPHRLHRHHTRRHDGGLRRRRSRRVGEPLGALGRRDGHDAVVGRSADRCCR